MKGKHHIIVETSNIKYEFDVKRNITVIQGQSATGKTTLIDILREYSNSGNKRGITLVSDVPCAVYSGTDEDWEYVLKGMSGRIIFFDEGNSFIYTKKFAKYVDGADNYFVFITRRPLNELPYSINEIYGIRTSGKFHFPEQVYHELYPIFSDELCQNNEVKYMLLLEDSKSGYQFFENVLTENIVSSAEGNSNIYLRLLELKEQDKVLVIADGAAFGAYIENVLKLSVIKGSVALYFPESFEWMILKSGVIENNDINTILNNTYDYVDSTEYLSWEQFFTSYLIELTQDEPYMRYSKKELPEYYIEGRNKDRIINVMPFEVRQMLGL